MLWIENIYRIITGLMFTCAAWSEQVDHFSQKVDHAVLVMDNRGVGNSELSVAELRFRHEQPGFWT